MRYPGFPLMTTNDALNIIKDNFWNWFEVLDCSADCLSVKIKDQFILTYNFYTDEFYVTGSDCIEHFYYTLEEAINYIKSKS